MLTAPSPSRGWLGLVPTCSENFPGKPGLDTRRFLVGMWVKQGVTAKALKIGPQVESKGSQNTWLADGQLQGSDQTQPPKLGKHYICYKKRNNKETEKNKNKP